MDPWGSYEMSSHLKYNIWNRVKQHMFGWGAKLRKFWTDVVPTAFKRMSANELKGPILQLSREGRGHMTRLAPVTDLSRHLRSLVRG